MLANDDQGSEDPKPQNWTAPDISSFAHPLRSNPIRSITSRGAIFTNLGEAHQAITSRLASRSAGHQISDTPSQASSVSSVNVSGPTDSVDSLPSAQHLEFARPTNPVARQCLTPLLGPSMSAAEWDKAFANSSPASSANAPSASSSGGNILPEGTLNVDVRESPANPMSSETGSTMENIYEQYLPSSVAESSSSIGDPLCASVGGAPLRDKYSQHPETTSESTQEDAPQIQSLVEHDQNPLSLDVRQTASPKINNQAKNHWQMYSSAGDPPQAPLPELPRAHRDTHRSAMGFNGWPNLSPATQSANSVSNSEALLGEPTKGTRCSALTVTPTYTAATYAHNNHLGSAQSIIHPVEHDAISYGDIHHARGNSRDRAYHENDMSHCGVSNGGVSIGGFTSDSDDDPFRYDRGSFTVFLKPSREREVSVALRCVSGEYTASSNGNVQSSPSNGPLTPCAPLFSANEPTETANRTIPSNNPFFKKLQFYQAPAVNYNWEDDDDPSEVRISVRLPPAPPPAPPNSPALSAINPAECTQWSGDGLRTEELHTIMSDGCGDWETVATTVGQFDSNRAFASSTSFSGCHPTKFTGSSIADYSDAGSFRAPRFDAFSSTERILQHPTGGLAPNTRFYRTLKDTGRPVFLPKPRIHRVNGYLQDSSRIFTDPTTGSSGTSTRSYLVEKLSASIRSRSARKRAQLRNPYHNLERWSRSGTFDSLFSADGEQRSTKVGQQVVCNPTETGSITEETGTLVPNEHLLTNQKIGHTQARGSLGQESSTLFPFPLISLEEAARCQAFGVENGEEEGTITSGTRTRKDSSVNSSRGTQRTTPPTPYITKPRPTHRRYPTPAGIPGSSVSYHRYSGHSQERNLIRHQRGISDASSFRRGTPLVPRQSAFSRSARNTFDSFNGSLATRPSFLGPPYVLNSPHLFGRDKKNPDQGTNSTADLRQIANLETAAHFGVLTEDAYLSWDARKRRKAYYYAMCILCVFPFMAPLVYKGTFDSVLSWCTRGEVAQLNRQQRRNVLILGSIVSAVWLCALGILITLVVNGKEKVHAHT